MNVHPMKKWILAYLDGEKVQFEIAGHDYYTVTSLAQFDKARSCRIAPKTVKLGEM